MLPDASITVDYIVHIFHEVISGLKVFPDRMMANVELTQGVVFSQRVLHALIDAGMDRHDAYRIVQQDSLRALDTGVRLEAILAADADVIRRVPADRLAALFDYHHFTRNISVTFERVGLTDRSS
jgi:adenylosuccinate lyase